jgi:glycosidase
MPAGCYNSPDGWYASDVHTVARVTELKQLVSSFHEEGIKVIMDVVYNHTAEDCGNERNIDARFSFNGLAPRYYYRNCMNTPISYNGERMCAKKGGYSGNDSDSDCCGTSGGATAEDSQKAMNCGTCVVRVFRT